MLALALTSACGGSGGAGVVPTAPASTSATPSPSPSPTPIPTPSGGGGSGGGGGTGGNAGAVTVAGFVPGAILLSGTCPAIRFGVESKATGAYIDTVITTDASTQYSGGACPDVRLGVLLEVHGDPQPDKSLRAVLVKFTPKGLPVRAR